MLTELEKQIRDLQKELAELQREQAALRLQPCKGDAEIRKKEEGRRVRRAGWAGRNFERNHPGFDKKTPVVDFRSHFKRKLGFPPFL